MCTVYKPWLLISGHNSCWRSAICESAIWPGCFLQQLGLKELQPAVCVGASWCAIHSWKTSIICWDLCSSSFLWYAETICEASVYGKRDGSIQGFAVVHKDNQNLLRSTKGWKTGTVLDISMLGRSEMWKPDPPVSWQTFEDVFLNISFWIGVFHTWWHYVKPQMLHGL